MKTLLILGAGTGGTMIANKMARKLDPAQWRILIVDRQKIHTYQPGFLCIPFGLHRPDRVQRPGGKYLPRGAEFIHADIERIEPDENRVQLAGDGRVLHYDQMVIATGSDIHPEETEGMLDGGGWHENIFDFYTLEGAVALGNFLKTWQGGRLVINITELPIKCPIAPLEFAFLSDWFFRERGIRNKVEIVFATPLSGAFTLPHTSAMLGGLLAQKGVHLETDFHIAKVDAGSNTISSWNDRTVGFDLLVTIPTNMGAPVMARSGMGDDLNFIPADPYTLQSKKWQNVWVIGDAGGTPAPKAGSVIHYQGAVLAENIVRQAQGESLLPDFDGHTNCVIEAGYKKGIMIDFDYQNEPIPGRVPIPLLGPFSLLKVSRLSHLAKLSIRWLYWNVLLKGGRMPLQERLTARR